MVYVPATIRFGIECDSYRVQKYFPRTFQELKTELQKVSMSYYTPFPVPAFAEGFDWDNKEYARVMFLTTFKKEDIGMQKMETFVLQDTDVFIMNASGTTVDKLKI